MRNITFKAATFYLIIPAIMASVPTQIDAWLEKHGLNRFGDEQGTMYMGGTPLFNEMTGESKDRLTYLKEKFPNLPWEQSAEEGDDSRNEMR
mmetsp:Transcript_18177/g.22894  ORF Transcript_18177/g.22894 Transcript_18177/m.22894 type:complete len:92 (-) Transcript_18177:247-522(-)